MWIAYLFCGWMLGSVLLSVALGAVVHANSRAAMQARPAVVRVPVRRWRGAGGQLRASAHLR
jgi:hypothetical protein